MQVKNLLKTCRFYFLYTAFFVDITGRIHVDCVGSLISTVGTATFWAYSSFTNVSNISEQDIMLHKDLVLRPKSYMFAEISSQGNCTTCECDTPWPDCFNWDVDKSNFHSRISVRFVCYENMLSHATPFYVLLLLSGSHQPESVIVWLSLLFWAYWVRSFRSSYKDAQTIWK